MTVASETNRAGPYTGNGVTQSFAYGFRIVSQSHLRVVRADAVGMETVLSLGSQYTVTGTGASGGGSVVLTAPLPSGNTLTILRAVPFVQETDLENQGAYYAETVEDALDLAVMRDQQIMEQLSRAVVVPASSPGAGELSLELSAGILRLAGSADNVDAVADALDDVAAVAAISDDVSAVAESIGAVVGMSGSILSMAAESYVGDGSNSSFTLPAIARGAANVLVFLDGVRQVPGVDYLVGGASLGFVAPPADGAAIDVLVATAVSMEDARALVEEVRNASQVIRAQFVTVAGQTLYAVGSNGLPFSVTEDGHILFGASPFGPLTYGIDYLVVGGGIQFTFDPGEGSLFHLVTMPRFTNSEAQALLDGLSDAVEAAGLVYPSRAAAIAALSSLSLGVQKVSWNSGVGVIDVARKVGATDIPDMLGWVPDGVATPEHYGAIGNGVANDTAALNAWGGQAGRGMLRGTYRVTANIQVARNRVDATGAVIIYDGAGYGRMVDMTTAGARWAGGELDGNFKASVGIYSTAGGCVVDGAEIHGLRSLVEQCSGVWMVGPNGGTARNCEIYDLSAVGDGSFGDGNGPSRAVLMTSLTAMTAPFIIEDNEARDIAGEEGDAYQVMANNGTYPFLSAAWSIIRRNTARGFNRRGIKIQASDVICEDNILIAPTATAGLGPQSVIDVIAANNVIVRRNFTVSALGMRAIGIAKPPAAPKMTGIVIEGNIHNGVADADSITIDGVSQAIVNGNVHISGRRALYIVNSEQTAIRGNIAANSVTDGTYSDFEIANTNTRMLVEGNVSLGGTKYASVGAKSSLSIFRNTTSLRPVGAVIATTSTAVDSMITGTVAMTSSGVAVAGLSEAHTAISDSIQLGTIGGSLSNKLIWTTGDPATKRAGCFHTVGDVAWNAAGLSPVGWKCTASGTPGTWAAF